VVVVIRKVVPGTLAIGMSLGKRRNKFGIQNI
jgi:hypothetical protein